MRIKLTARLLFICHVFLGYRLLALIPRKYLPWYLKAVVSIGKLYPHIDKNLSAPERLNKALERLGPVWIKLGQMLSTRKDLLSEEFSQQLSLLQDQVTPFPVEKAITRIKSELHIQQLSETFAEFDETPLATASIAQVHSAKLIDAAQPDVVVKIIRPGIHQQIIADVALMKVIANLAKHLMSEGKRFRPDEVVAEYERTILAELNLKQEANNGQKLKDNFIDSDDLYIPHIYSELCTKNILVMERINGIPVSDIEALKSQGSDLESLAARGVRVFFTQVFRDSFFHADMHPGNIFISKQNPQDPKYIGIDFGIVGTLNYQDKRYLAENFVAFFNRDYRKVAELHVQSGWVPNHVDVALFEQSIRDVCDPIFNKPLSEISFAQVLIGLFDTAREFEMQVQPQLVLLQKTLLYVEGLGRQLYPELDLWQTAKPFLEQWVNEQMGFKAFFEKSKNNAPYWLEKAPEIPELVHRSLTEISQLPAHKQELIDKYLQAQKAHRIFLVQLSLFSTGLLALLLAFLLAEPTTSWWWAKAVLIGFNTLLGYLIFRKLK